MSLTLKVKTFIQKNHLFSFGDKVIVGVSGGADSACLLHVLNQFKYELGLTLIVAHYNHRLRKESGEDQKFVQKLAEQYQLNFVTDTCKESQKKYKGSLEDWARQKRLTFFQKASKRFNTKLIALAHTQDDLAETVLMRIMRGSGLKGLQSILPQRTVNGLILIRPFLNISKSEILNYIKKHKLNFKEDKTNKSTQFFRNKIRLELLPLLKKEYNPGIAQNLIHIAKNAAIDYDFIETKGLQAYKQILVASKKNIRGIDLPKFLKLHPAIQKIMIRLIVSDLNPDAFLENRHYEEIYNLLKLKTPRDATIHLTHHLRVRKSKTRLTFELH